jgi:hypothetical protein
MIDPVWWPTLEATVGEYQQRYSDLISVYLRGSIPSGTATPGFSDVDAVAVLQGEHDIDRDWCTVADRRVLARHRCASEVTFSITSLESAVNDRKTGFFLKTHALVLFGKDVAQRIEPYRVDHDAVTHLFNVEQDWATFERVSRGDDPGLASLVLRRLIKRIIRSGFELVAEREQRYTRDLRLCSATFASYYPARAQDMAKVATLLVDGDPAAELPVIRDMVGWLAGEAEVVYPGHVTTVTYIDDLGVDC